MFVLAVDVIDSGINLSDHCPIVIEVSIPRINKVPRTTENNNKHQLPVYRWDLGDTVLYQQLTGDFLNGISPSRYSGLDSLSDSDVSDYINAHYNDIVCSLREASRISIPRKKHGYQKFWWDEELNLLKQNALQSFNIWASLGKPWTGTFFDNMRRDKALYKLAIRTKRKERANEFSDCLNDALLCKDMNGFWKSLRSRFGGKPMATVIDGLYDDKAIADRFANVFQAACVPNSLTRHVSRLCLSYPILSKNLFYLILTCVL